MRRVSSRQRLVSWDAFDATVRPDSGNGNDSSITGSDGDEGEECAFCYSSNLDGPNTDDANLIEGESDQKDTKHWMRRRKRDRKSLKSCYPERTVNSCKNVEIPKSSPSITPTVTRCCPTFVTAYSWELSAPTLPNIHFNDLIDDVHLGIFSFLDLSSLISVFSVNRRYQKLMISDDARCSVWFDYCEKRWHTKKRENDQSPLKFVDNFHLPMAAATSITATTFGSELAKKKSDVINLSLLLSLTPTNFPTSIDQTSLKPRRRLSRDIQQTIPIHRREEEDQLLRCYEDSVTGRSTVRYTGHVGQGDRCIRSNHPLPRPTRRTSTSAREDCSRNKSASASQFLGFRLNSILRIRDGVHYLKSPSSISTFSTSEPSSEWTPFVMPFADQSFDGDAATVNVTPRFVSYFEVSILELEDNLENEESMSTMRQPLFRQRGTSDCVAVGVATSSFKFQSRMPGWDRLSYGYHGDDGGIFHSSGGMIKQFGPKYGPGDTVGCGIDYISKGIFYTLNGEFLGYAWENLSFQILQEDLYPAVGIDTNFPIRLNLGSANSESFKFNLSNFIKKDEKTISSMYSLERLCWSDNMGSPVAKQSNGITADKNCVSISGLSASRRQRKNIAAKRNARGWQHR